MLFGSVLFLFRFLPFFFALYFISPAKHKKKVLLLGGVVFCAFNSIVLLLTVMFVCFISFFGALLIQKARHKKNVRKIILFLSLIFIFAIPVFTVYPSVISKNPVAVFGVIINKSASLFGPLGLLIYTLSSTSYLIDVYRKKAKAQPNLLSLAVYIFMFPSFIVGPILNYAAMENELCSNLRNNPVLIDIGVERFILGLGMKLLLADTVGALWRGIVDKNGIGLSLVSTPLSWLVLFSFIFQLYFELSGYSSMAIGIINMLGYNIPQNFDQPFCARSVSEFFGRWNISLISWVKNYIYFPLTKSKKKSVGFFALIASCVFVAFWFGASVSFVLAALLVSFFILLEKTHIAKALQKSSIFSRIFTLAALVFVFAFVANGAEGISTSVLLEKMFIPQHGVGALYYFMNYIVPLVLCLFFCTALPRFLYGKISKIKALRIVVLLVIFAISIVFMQANSTQNVSLISV